MGKIIDFVNALKSLGDGRYHYWDGQTGIGCSDYVRMALGLAGVITKDEANNPYCLWAAQQYRSVLRDKTRFIELPPTETPQDGDIEWYHGHHVAVFYKGGQFEAAPESTHYLSNNGKTAVGYFPKHHNCSGGQLTCYYRIIESVNPTEKITAKLLIERAIDVCLGKYGKTAYNNHYPYNVGYWDGSRWSFDCLGFVHTLVNGFTGVQTKLGGGAIMDDFVNNCNEAATLNSCTEYAKFNGREPAKGELLQSSGHVGLYIGEYKVTRSDGTVDVYNTAECTTAFGGGCMLTWVDISNGYRYNKKGGTYRSIWNYHGKLNRVQYVAEADPVMPEPEEPTPKATLTETQKLMTAIEVINNKWGNNPDRRKKLTELYGSDVAIQIQDLVNLAFRK